MRATTYSQPFELPPELKDDPFLVWLRDHAHEDLWMPRIPLAVKERIRARFTGQKRTTLIRVWMGIRSLLLARSVYGGSILSVRDIADAADVSRSRLCGNDGYIQDLLDTGVIGVTVVDDDKPALKDLYKGRTLYHIDMAALEDESLMWLRRRYSDGDKDHVPRREADPRQGNLLDMMSDKWQKAPGDSVVVPHGTGPGPATPSDPGSPVRSARERSTVSTRMMDGAVPSGADGDVQTNAIAVPIGTALVSSETAVALMSTTCGLHPASSVPIGATADPVHVPVETTVVSNGTTSVPLGAVGMDGIGMEGKGGEGEKRPLSQRETLQIVHTAIQEALAPAIQQALAALSDTQQIGVPLPPRGPAAPQGEPPIGRGPLELWTLYRRGEPDPLELDRLALLPSQFDEPSGGHGAYWVARAILMLTEAERPITVPYLRGVLERMRRAGEWSTAQLEAPPEEHERGRAAVAAALPPPPRVVTPTPPAPPAVSGERTALTIFRQYAGSTKLLPEQERQIAERVRDLEIWEVVCANWRENGWKFDSPENLLDRYCKTEAERAKDRPATGGGLSKLERAIHEIPGLSDEEKAHHCAQLLQYVPDDRKRYVEDLRRHCAHRGGEPTTSTVRSG